MRAATFTEAFAALGLGVRNSMRARLKPSREDRLEQAVEPVLMEVLEGRRLFSCSFNSGTGVLTATGSSAGETITAFRIHTSTTDYIYVRISTEANDCGPYTFSAVTKIVVNAGAGDDTVKIEDTDDVAVGGGGLSTTGFPVSKNTELNGGTGLDTINGGDGNDTIHGDYDNDTLNGRGGNDTMYGDASNDTMDGGAGNDIMYGGYGDNLDVGADTLDGNTGNDTLYGEGGNDTLITGTGTDAAYGGAGNDDFRSGDGDQSGAGDYLDGGAGSDRLLSFDNADTSVSIEL